MPPEKGKGTKRNVKECVSTSATYDLHTYFICRSATKKNFLTKKKHPHIEQGGAQVAARGTLGAGSCWGAPYLFVGSYGANGGQSGYNMVLYFSSRRQSGLLRCRPSEFG